MRNVWPYIVGFVLLVGVAIALFNGISTSEPVIESGTQTRSPSTAKSDKDPESSVSPDASFSEITIDKTDLIVGNENAPVTIIEYSSLTCPHCSDFHKKVLPVIKREFVDTNKVRLIYRDFPLDQWALRAAIIARCAGPKRRYRFIQTFFLQQEQWTSGDPAAGLVALAKLGGLTMSSLEKCLSDKQMIDSVIKERLAATKQFAIRSTPTIIVNGDLYSGGLEIEQLRSVIEEKLKTPKG
ncbi:MAG: DsbA family protein [Pseudomonadota bacterium]|nr:DsbA family protein [Pseudomonadota bacterium]